MKFLKNCLIVLLTVCLVLGLASCTGGFTRNTLPSGGVPVNSGDTPSGAHSKADGEGYETPVDAGSFGDRIEGSYGEPSEYGTEPSEYGTEPSDVGGKSQNALSAGQITAAAWNENLHYDFWKSLFAEGQSEEENGKFRDYYLNDRWGCDSTQRVTVTVKQGENPVTGATVTCVDAEGAERFVAKTGADGIAYLFPEVKEGTLKVKSGNFSAEAPFTAEISDVKVQLDGAERKQDNIQIMMVIDVTGSMGDELTYLQVELEDVINRVAAANKNATIELALLFYRDNGDDEKFAYSDFVNVNSAAGLNKQLNALRNQYATGGGDTPEAVDEALELAMSKAWSNDNSTKIIFHVLDAPPHSNDGNPQANYEQRFEAAVRKAAGMGIRLCPVLCSGADLLCEYLTRQEAIYTGGTFIFVTDDSGIGGEHLDPNIPDAVVEKLNDLMVRLIDGYHTGVFADPVPWKASAQTDEQ